MQRLAATVMSLALTAKAAFTVLRLRGGQGGVGQRVGAEGMVEDIGGARQQEPQGVGQEGRR
jgi:hypothetical protein